MATKTIPLYLVSGFLGSGKSSFLHNIIEAFGNDTKIGIVQNEFSSVNIDARILAGAKGNYSVLEVNKGSVFCLCLLNDFIPSLANFIDDCRPDKVFIEATGLADPLAILQMINSPLLVDKVRFSRAYTIVDAFLFDRQVNMLKSVTNQIRVADTVLINKCDKLNKTEAEAVGVKVNEINPFCNILYSRYASLNSSELELIKSDSGSAQMLTNVLSDDCKPLSSPPDIQVKNITTSKKISPENLKVLTDIMKPMLRTKGFIRIDDGSVKAVQSVCGEFSVKDYDLPVSRSEMVFFGEEINLTLINRLFDR